MLRYMLDTNLCIRVLRDRPSGLRPRFNAEADGPVPFDYPGKSLADDLGLGACQ